ncbi:hypothetical protein BC941DRAFT_468952 [Chlamydoabsidia padenii]|nr:hypothetical protein BC941DRAFT_468952 [Chlamydoabsidia padenii]
MSELNLANEQELFKQHLCYILKSIQDQTGPSVDLDKLHGLLLPAFFSNTKLAQWQQDVPVSSTIQPLRNIGFMTFYQSLTEYALINYNSLNTTFLERIILQAMSLLPLVKVAESLQLNLPLYDAECRNSDRLAVLVGALNTHYGSQVMNNFLYPLFAEHIFTGKHFARTDPIAHVYNFGTMVKSRGGNITVEYKQLQDNTNQSPHKWECSIIYQLAHQSPFVQHCRTGQNKKQAKNRVLHDIDNFYLRNNDALVRHCSPSPNCDNKDPRIRILQQPETLSIPIDQRHQYEDNIQQSIPMTQLPEKRTLDSTMEDTVTTNGGMDNEDNNNDDDDDNEHISILSHVLLSDFSKLSFNEKPPAPTPNIVPSGRGTASPLVTNGHSLVSPAPSPTSGMDGIQAELKMERCEDEVINEDTDSGTNKKQRTDLQLDHGMTRAHQGPDLFPSPISPQSLHNNKLSAIAFNIISLLPGRDRQKLTKIKQHFSQKPNDVKGYLKNLAGKLTNGYYETSTEHAALTKSAVNTTAYYQVTVRFGVQGAELVLTRNNTKKSDAEGMAALGIFNLLDAALHDNGNSPQQPLGNIMVQ